MLWVCLFEHDSAEIMLKMPLKQIEGHPAAMNFEDTWKRARDAMGLSLQA